MENKVVDYASYEALAITTKCYSDKVAYPYVTLGLCGELGELYEKLSKESEDTHLIELEFQDIMWYLAAIRIEFNLEKKTDWPTLSGRKVGPFDLPAAIGKIAEQLKKYLRDDWKENETTLLSEERKKKIQSAWDEIMQIMVDFNNQAFNRSMNEQGQQNIDKLADRAKRNQIHGSGDLR